jgi:hypothetical protein
LEEPGYVSIERHRFAWVATRALISAAIISGIRASLIPFLIMKSPSSSLNQMDPHVVEITGFFMMVVFVVAAIYAMQKPLIAVAASLMLYLAISIPDYLQGSGFLGKGVISKGVMLLVLTRALIAGFQHHMLDHGQSKS